MTAGTTSSTAAASGQRSRCEYCGARRRAVVEVAMEWDGGQAMVDICQGCRNILSGRPP